MWRAFPYQTFARRMTFLSPAARMTRRHFDIGRNAIAALLVSSVLLVACKDKPPPQRATPVVSVTRVQRGPLPFVITATGEVEPNRTVAVQSLVSGMLTSVAITEGQEVRQGQVLFQIDPRPFRAELDRVRATLTRDQAQLARARADSTRFAALAKDGYITRQQLDQTFGEVNALAATVDAGRAQVQAAQLDLENATVRAPISGRTGQLSLRAGNLVRAQADPPLVTINELSPVLVRFAVPEGDFEEMRRRAGLDQALPVRITAGQRADSGRVTIGSLAFIDNMVDRTTGSVLLKARAANTDRVLWPGQFVSVGLELSVDQDAVTIPTEAVVTSPNGSFVFVLNDSSRATRVGVKIGRTIGSVVKVDSGLTGGEQVVVEGQTRLSDGARVQLRDTTRAVGGRSGRGSRGQAPTDSASRTTVPAKGDSASGAATGGGRKS
jgi:multidrug efflux system membrane fusion protein